MAELIAVREAARRIGVSDTAVHKAIKAGRVFIAGTNPKNGRPLLEWPKVAEDWKANSADHKRTHVGGRGDSPERAKYAKTGPEIELVVANKPSDSDPDTPAGVIPSYNESRAAREFWQAELARLEFEHKEKLLIPADDVKIAWFKHITAAKTRVMSIPAACKTRCSDLPLEVVATIDAICREALEDLANGNG